MSQPLAILTGAGRGIGRAIAIELARRGYALAITSRTQSELDETLALCGGKGLALVGDVSDVQHVNRLVATAQQKFGRIDAAVHNAGFAPIWPVRDMTDAQWHRVIDTNLSAAFYLARAVWPAFERQGGGGVIVNISSLASRDPFAGLGAYGAAKAGVNLLGLALAREGAPIGVRAHTIAPGAVETSMFRQIASVEQYPQDKTLHPEDVAAVVGQCVSGELKYASGEVIFLHKNP